MLDGLARKIAARLEIKPEDVAQRIATPHFARMVACNMPRPLAKCPVCDGSGSVEVGFYHTTAHVVCATSQAYPFRAYQDGYEECRTCSGSGTVR